MNQALTLLPKTMKGKEKIKLHGNQWLTVQKADKVGFSNEPGPWLLIVPVDPIKTVPVRFDSRSRWVNLLRDKDFEIKVLD